MEDREKYDFEVLVQCEPKLSAHVSISKRGSQTIDFSDPVAVRLLNTALVKSRYRLDYWSFPEDNLCPAVPGRADYIELIASVLADENNNHVPKGRKVSGIDIGTGASLIYPIIGRRQYGWQFVGSDIDTDSLSAAQEIIDQNHPKLSGVSLKLQENTISIFDGLIGTGDFIDFTMCNPPFHDSEEMANKANRRKVSSLKKEKVSSGELNFSGRANELWTDGGEVGFVSRMISESAQYPKSCLYYTTLISKEASVAPIEKVLRTKKPIVSRVINRSIGNKKSRILIWSFLPQSKRQSWAKLKW